MRGKGGRFDIMHPVMTWLCEFVSYMMSRMEVATDGKTTHDTAKRKREEVLALEFCEKVMWKHHPGKRMDKMTRWSLGLCIGYAPTLASCSSRTARLGISIISEQARGFRRSRGGQPVPRNRDEADAEADGDLPEFDVKKGPGRQLAEDEKQDMRANETPKIAHTAHLRKAYIDKHGYSDRCAGCSAILRGLNTQPHSSKLQATHAVGSLDGHHGRECQDPDAGAEQECDG